MTHPASLGAHRRRGAAGAEELDGAHPGTCLAQPVQLARELREPYRDLGAERGGHRLLTVRPARHDGVPVGRRQVREPVPQLDHEGLEPRQGGVQLERLPGVHDVLGRGPPVEPRANLGGRVLPHQRQQAHDGVAHVSEPLVERTLGDRQAIDPSRDGGGGVPRHQPRVRLRHGQRPLHGQPGTDGRRLREDLGHLGVAERVEQHGPGVAGRHRAASGRLGG